MSRSVMTTSCQKSNIWQYTAFSNEGTKPPNTQRHQLDVIVKEAFDRQGAGDEVHHWVSESLPSYMARE